MAEDYSASAQVALALGEEAWAKLHHSFGGLTIDIPARAKGRGALAALLRTLLGQEAFCVLVREAGGTELYIPKRHRQNMAIRNAVIVQSFLRMKADGSSSKTAAKNLSRRYSVTERRIYGIVSAGR